MRATWVRLSGVCLLSLLAGCGGDRTRPPADPPRAANLLLITIDTLRADRVGAYGHPGARTPALDALAREGVRFDRAFATAPITLTSHASLLTGLYPPGHGARNNGMAMRAVPTLATVLRERGFATAAFVAAFPLDRRFGLARGFDTYGDALPRGRDGRPINERAAPVVANEAIAWLAKQSGARFFLWVHFFEPHAPYGDPGAAAGRPPLERYDDEIAIADREAGRVVAALGARARDTIVVVAGDHGEAFGEHGEVAHGLFVYDTTLRVPLLMAGPTLKRGTAVNAPVSLVDVVPTALAALGLPALDTDGIDLRRGAIAGDGGDARALYAESFAPRLEFGWSSLRAVRSGRWKYIAAPTPELYDLESDAGETVSVLPAHASLAATLDARVNAVSGPELPDGAVPPAAADPEGARRLQALGYVGGGARPAAGRADPKDRKVLARRLALVASSELEGPALEDALRAILHEDPGNGLAHVRLAYVVLGKGGYLEAERHFRAAAAGAVPSADAWLGLAQCAGAQGDLRGAESALRRANAVEPGNPVVAANLGILYSKAGRHEEAQSLLSRVVRDDPQFDEARFNLALAYARGGRRADAMREAADLLRRLPPEAPQRAEVQRLLATLSKQE